jgi:hypothetical protein
VKIFQIEALPGVKWTFNGPISNQKEAENQPAFHYILTYWSGTFPDRTMLVSRFQKFLEQSISIELCVLHRAIDSFFKGSLYIKIQMVYHRFNLYLSLIGSSAVLV